MSVGPVSGNGITLTLAPGKTVFWTAVAQADFPQYLQLRDSANTIIFTAQGASTGGGAPTQIGSGNFTVADASGRYSAYIGTYGGSRWSSVLWDQTAITLGATVYFNRYTFISEDSVDQDYNDSCLSLVWFNSLG